MTDKGSGVVGERVSRISLVDLAGSERALKTGKKGFFKNLGWICAGF